MPDPELGLLMIFLGTASLTLGPDSKGYDE